jgi:hypothetical protein
LAKFKPSRRPEGGGARSTGDREVVIADVREDERLHQDVGRVHGILLKNADNHVVGLIGATHGALVLDVVGEEGGSNNGPVHLRVELNMRGR